MKIAHIVSAASLATMLVFSGAAIAANTNDTDHNGMKSLGIDISSAGSTPESIKTFMASLTPDQAAKVKTGCETVVANQANQVAEVLSFCQAYTGKM